MTLIAILCLYTALLSWISYAQIRFLEREKDKQAQILSEKDYQNAADIAIENEKFKLFSNFYNLIINIAWIGFGFLYLKELLISSNTRFENTLFLLSFWNFLVDCGLYFCLLYYSDYKSHLPYLDSTYF